MAKTRDRHNNLSGTGAAPGRVAPTRDRVSPSVYRGPTVGLPRRHRGRRDRGASAGRRRSRRAGRRQQGTGARSPRSPARGVSGPEPGIPSPACTRLAVRPGASDTASCEPAGAAGTEAAYPRWDKRFPVLSGNCRPSPPGRRRKCGPGSSAPGLSGPGRRAGRRRADRPGARRSAGWSPARPRPCSPR